MLDACVLWGSILTTGSAFAGAFYTLTFKMGVADSANLIVLGLGLLIASYVVRKRSVDAV